MSSLFDLRHHEFISALDEAALEKNPLQQCQKWLDEALASQFYQANAMALTTVDADNRPSCRIVLLKEISPQGFIFYSHFASRKGHDMRHNPFVSLLFYWDKLQRQIRIEGKVTRLDEATADLYFASRPRESQLNAWASPQSQVVAERATLEAKMAQYERQFAGKEVPRPAHWGGFLVVPDCIEFWQGRPNRLHDRLVYQRQDAQQWHIVRLAP